MRILFIGRLNRLNSHFANWLNERHEVIAYFRADVERYTPGYYGRWLRQRVKRKGLLRAADEVAFQLYYRAFQHRKDSAYLLQAFTERFGTDATLAPNITYYEFPSLNTPEAIATLKALQPDAGFAVCVTEYLTTPWLEIPTHGTLLYHEGLTPEYKGVHTAFWANHNGEADRIGYTLLRMSAKIDAGRPLAQGLGDIPLEKAHYWAYSGHKALMDGLPDVERALALLDEGQRPQVTRQPTGEGTYSYAGLTDEIRRAWRRLRDRHVGG